MVLFSDRGLQGMVEPRPSNAQPPAAQTEEAHPALQDREINLFITHALGFQQKGLENLTEQEVLHARLAKTLTVHSGRETTLNADANFPEISKEELVSLEGKLGTIDARLVEEVSKLLSH